MRQLRRGAPFGWFMALLLPLLVSGGLGGGGGGIAAALLRHTTVAQAHGEHQPLSRPFLDGVQRHTLVTGLTGIGAGAGGHPLTTPPTDLRYLSLAAGALARPSGDDDTRSLADPLVTPGRAPPASTLG